MKKCKHKDCDKEALFRRNVCWAHVGNQQKYRRVLLRGDGHGNRNFQGANLAGADLSLLDLEEVDLGEANLAAAHLVRAKLWCAKLRGANLRNADLTGAGLVSARLPKADLDGAILWKADLEAADLMGANIVGAYLNGTNLRRANLVEADLTNADLINANLNEADLTEATLTGAKVWGMSHLGCKTENLKAEYLNFDKDGRDSGIIYLKKGQADEFFSSQPSIEILLHGKLPPYAIQTLLDLIVALNKQRPDWGVELRKFTSSSFFSELAVKARRDEILEEVANIILGAFDKRYQQKLLEYLPDKKATEERGLILKELGRIEKKIGNPVEQVTIIHSTGEIPVNLNFKESEVRVNVFGDVAKMINVEGNHYEVSAPDGREDLLRALIDQLDSPEIGKKMEESETELRGLSKQQLKFLEEEFRQIAEKIFREKKEQPGFADKVKEFSRRFAQSTVSGVVSKAIWYVIQKLM